MKGYWVLWVLHIADAKDNAVMQEHLGRVEDDLGLHPRHT